MREVWRCKCRRSFASGVASARCPHCESAFRRDSEGRVRVTNGDWHVLHLPASAKEAKEMLG